MARRKITNSQAVCITLLWGILCYMMLAYSEKITFDIVLPWLRQLSLCSSLSIRAEGEETSDI